MTGAGGEREDTQREILARPLRRVVSDNLLCRPVSRYRTINNCLVTANENEPRIARGERELL